MPFSILRKRKREHKVKKGPRVYGTMKSKEQMFLEEKELSVVKKIGNFQTCDVFFC